MYITILYILWVLRAYVPFEAPFQLSLPLLFLAVFFPPLTHSLTHSQCLLLPGLARRRLSLHSLQYHFAVEFEIFRVSLSSLSSSSSSSSTLLVFLYLPFVCTYTCASIHKRRESISLSVRVHTWCTCALVEEEGK